MVSESNFAPEKLTAEIDAAIEHNDQQRRLEALMRCRAALEASHAKELQMNDAILKAAVDRFLSWKLPATFGPDCGISFDGRGKDAHGFDKGWPVGTNLFTADEALAMFKHCLAGLEASHAPVPEPDWLGRAVALLREIDRHGVLSIATQQGAGLFVREYDAAAGTTPETKP